MKVKTVITAVALAATTMGTLAATPSFADARHDRLTAQRNFWKGHAMRRGEILRAQRANIASLNSQVSEFRTLLSELAPSNSQVDVLAYYDTIAADGVITDAERNSLVNVIQDLVGVGDITLTHAQFDALNDRITDLTTAVNNKSAKIRAGLAVDALDYDNGTTYGQTAINSARAADTASVANTAVGYSRTHNVIYVGPSATGANQIDLNADIGAISIKIKQHIDAEKERSYNEGYADGYTDGYSDGFTAGVNKVKAEID